ncbi:hypothetical protein ACEPPN_007528 [Leptodophora sp. 'Broadleaf-Isolate-01']
MTGTGSRENLDGGTILSRPVHLAALLVADYLRKRVQLSGWKMRIRNIFRTSTTPGPKRDGSSMPAMATTMCGGRIEAD